MIGPLWGELQLFRGVLGLSGMKKNFKIGQIIKKSYMTLKYLLIIDFPKFEPLTAAEMALCGNLDAISDYNFFLNLNILT